MSLAHAMWTHGHSMQVEFQDRVFSITRTGYCVAVEGKPGSQNWFHFAVPTPVIVDDIRLKAQSVLIRFKCGSSDAYVNAVHVYDGEGKIAEFNSLSLNPTDWTVQRFVVPNPPAIQWGLGISIGVGFGVENMSHGILLSAAGCDFLK